MIFAVRSQLHIILFACAIFLSLNAQAQLSGFTITPGSEAKFSPYMAARHGGDAGLAAFKQSNTNLYFKELWYFSESFYVKRNHLAEGVAIDESMIDITRFEHLRQINADQIVTFPGLKDALILTARSRLLYHPNYPLFIK
jgi:hypothetical protein